MSAPQKKVKSNILERPFGLLPNLSLFRHHFGNDEEEESEVGHPQTLLQAIQRNRRRESSEDFSEESEDS